MILLNQSQQKELNKIFNDLSVEIQELIDSAKEDWKKNENKEAFQRGLYMGKLGAFTTCLQLFRNRADTAYKYEMDSADLRLLKLANLIEKQLMALKQIASDISDNPGPVQSLENQIALLEAVVKDIKLILKQTGTIMQ